jgi:hypothetical protein
MRKYISALLILLVLVGSAWSQQNVITPLGPGDILLTKPQRQALYLWLVARAPSYGSSTWWNLTGFSHGALSGFDGTSSSGWSSTSRKGGVGQLNFDGSNDIVNVTAPPGSGVLGTFDFRINVPFSITFWMKTTSSSVRDILEKKETASFAQGWWISVNASGNVDFGIRDTNSAAIQIQAGPVNDGLWHAMACVYNGAAANDPTTLSIYIDGALRSPTVIQSGPIAPAIHTGSLIPLKIAPNDGGGLPYVGALDDIRVYGINLSPAVIAEIAKGEIPLSQQPFISYALAAAARVKQKRRME